MLSLLLLALKLIPCSYPCTPPTTYVSVNSPVPFNAPVKFGREIKVAGNTMWVWVKDGEPPRPCTSAEAKLSGYKTACEAEIGEELYVTVPFFLAEVP